MPFSYQVWVSAVTESVKVVDSLGIELDDDTFEVVAQIDC